MRVPKQSKSEPLVQAVVEGVGGELRTTSDVLRRDFNSAFVQLRNQIEASFVRVLNEARVGTSIPRAAAEPPAASPDSLTAGQQCCTIPSPTAVVGATLVPGSSPQSRSSSRLRENNLVADAASVGTSESAEEAWAPQTDLLQVITEIRRAVRELDPAPLLKAVREEGARPAQVDFSPVLRAIRESRVEVDFPPALALQDRKNGRVLDQILRVVEDVKKILEATPWIEALDNYVGDADNKAIYNALCSSATTAAVDMDFTPVLEAMQECSFNIDLGPVLAAISDEQQPCQEDVVDVADVDYASRLNVISDDIKHADLVHVVRAIQQTSSVLERETGQGYESMCVETCCLDEGVLDSDGAE